MKVQLYFGTVVLIIHYHPSSIKILEVISCDSLLWRINVQSINVEK